MKSGLAQRAEGLRRLEPGPSRLIRQVRTSLLTALFAVLCVPTLVVCAATPGAAPRQSESAPPVSLNRIREGLEQAPALRLNTDVLLQLPPIFKSRVDQRVFVLTLEEALHKQFDLNLLQRQSAEWASKCCGYNLGQLVKSVNEALRAREIRRTREQIARELAELEAGRKTVPADVK